MRKIAKNRGFRTEFRFGQSAKRIALAALLFVLLSGSAAFASATSKYAVVKLAMNKTVTQKETGYAYQAKTGKSVWTYYRYRVQVPSEGVLRVTIGKGKSRISGLSLSMYDKKNAADVLDDWFFSGKKKKTVTIPVSKGTWFFSTAEKATLRCSFQAVKPGANYSAARAAVLKEGVKAKICQTPGYDFPRWYKITLQKSRKITFWSDQAKRVILVDQRKNPVPVKASGGGGMKYVSGEVLPKGTYYLCMGTADLDEKLYSNRYYYTTLYWK